MVKRMVGPVVETRWGSRGAGVQGEEEAQKVDSSGVTVQVRLEIVGI